MNETNTPKPLDLSRYEGHTPGPWAADDIGPAGWADIRVQGSRQPPHAYAVSGLGIPSINDVAANARLIADAPLLLAEVKRLRTALVFALVAMIREREKHTRPPMLLRDAINHARRVLGEDRSHPEP